MHFQKICLFCTIRVLPIAFQCIKVIYALCMTEKVDTNHFIDLKQLRWFLWYATNVSVSILNDEQLLHHLFWNIWFNVRLNDAFIYTNYLYLILWLNASSKRNHLQSANFSERQVDNFRWSNYFFSAEMLSFTLISRTCCLYHNFNESERECNAIVAQLSFIEHRSFPLFQRTYADLLGTR